MFVCEDCHEADKKVLGCNDSHGKHGRNIYGNCEICDEFDELIWCNEYTHKTKISHEEG